MGTAILIIAIIIGIVLIFAFFKSEDEKKITSSISSLDNFVASETYFAPWFGNTSISIDKPNRKICFVDSGNKGKKTSIYSYKDIYECRILTDGETYSSQSTTRSVAGYIVGGFLGGTAGAVIGGLGGKKKNVEKIKNIKLTIIVNDTTTPLYTVIFLDEEVKKGDYTHKDALKKAEYWHALISVYIKQANLEETSASKIHIPKQQISIAEELIKLDDLRKKNIISEDEFQVYKKRLNE